MRTLIVSLLFLAGIAMYIFWRTRRDQGIRRKTIAVADVGEVFRLEGVLLGRIVPIALLGDRVDENRAFAVGEHLLHVL